MQDMTNDQMRVVANVNVMQGGIAEIRPILATLDMPALAGTEKQIEWAENIRAHAIHMAVREMLISGPKGQKAAYANTAAKMVAEHSADAAWWIENREKADIMLRHLKSLAAK